MSTGLITSSLLLLKVVFLKMFSVLTCGIDSFDAKAFFIAFSIKLLMNASSSKRISFLLG